MFGRRPRFNRFRFPFWIRRIVDIIEIAILPLIVFQAIRTIFFPATFEVFILIGLGSIYLIFLKGWI